MNLSELVAEVVTLSGRPDAATTDIPLHVRAATLKMHQSDFYTKDLVEQQLTFSAALNIQQFDTSVLPRYRNLNYLRYYDPLGVDSFTQQTTGLAGAFFKILVPEDILDSYKMQKVDVCYVAGTTCNIRSRIAFRHVLCGWYQIPVITEAGFASWIADLVPYAIVFEATANYFKAIGYDEQSTAMRLLVADQFTMVRQTGLQAHGY